MTTPVIRTNALCVQRQDQRLGPWSILAHAGECVLLCGANGSGKSTLLGALAGVLPASSGTVDCTPDTIGYAPEPFEPPTRLCARELLTLVVPSASDALPGMASELAIDQLLDRRLADLSRGERKRVLMAQALLGRPALVLLDEPLEGLDPPSQARVIDAVYRYVSDGGCAVIASHRPHQWPGARCIAVRP